MTAKKVIRNSRRLEEDKKSKYIVIKSGKGKIEEIKESVKEGIMKRTDEYKYLRWWFNEVNIYDNYTKLRVYI